jgi:5-(carboxyamino)imidazole ribonucleotide synthase
MIIAPGATLGVLGSGQLGRMFTIAARRMGYRVHTFSPDQDTPTGQVADLEVTAPYEDLDALRAFAKDVAVVTFEFENVPSEAVHALDGLVPVRPSGAALYIAQQRGREKAFLSERQFPTVPFARASTLAQLQAGAAPIGLPLVIKSAAFGYDGKGQHKITKPAEIERAWHALGGQEVLVEKFVSLQAEISVIAARGVDGAIAEYAPFENRHSNHILDVTTAPAAIPAHVAARAREIARAILDALDYVGILCVEFFVTTDGDLLVNELAPRPHNSYHESIEGCATSQFEQAVRAICDLPLGDPTSLRPAAIANLLGELWTPDRAPPFDQSLRATGARLHLYGKREPRVGRKMGHVSATAATPREAVARAVAGRNVLALAQGVPMWEAGGWP